MGGLLFEMRQLNEKILQEKLCTLHPDAKVPVLEEEEKMLSLKQPWLLKNYLGFE